jgi:cytoplasmic FMR1 interacting protein
MVQKTLRGTMLSSSFLGIIPQTKTTKLKRQNDLDNCVEGEISDLLNYEKYNDPEKLPLLQTLTMATGLDPKDKRTRDLDFLKLELQQAQKAVKLYGPKKDIQSIMKMVFVRFKKILDASSSSWQGQSTIERLTKLDSSKEFYRLYALLQFIFCQEDKGNVGFSDLEYFGHGFFFGGLAVVYLYGQEKRFLAFNFTDHLLHVDQILEYQSKDRDTMDQFLKNATRTSSLNQWVFSMFKAFYSVPPSTSDTFNPPESEDYSKIKIISMEVKDDDERSLETIQSFKKIKQDYHG